MVRDVMCKNCDAKLGWIYEFATDEPQRYKEGKVGRQTHEGSEQCSNVINQRNFVLPAVGT